MNELPTYLAQDEEGDRSIALLSQNLYSLSELRADVSTDGAMLFRLSEEAAPVKFVLGPAEADAFVTVWTSFRQSQEYKALKEARRLAEARIQAFALAEDCPEISIETTANTDVWVVKRAEQIYSHDYASEFSYGPDELLGNVQRAKKAYTSEQRIQEDVEKAYKVAEQIEGISIEDTGPGLYCLTVFDQGRKWVPAKDLHATLKDMVNGHLTALLNAHPALHLDEVSPKTTEARAVWAITRDGSESRREVQGVVAVLATLNEAIEAECQEAQVEVSHA